MLMDAQRVTINESARFIAHCEMALCWPTIDSSQSSDLVVQSL